jgi:3-oxoacyl-[acyl-carrier protein] reductase
MFTSIANRNVIVTGATKGIGKGIAKVFAKQGANVMIVGRSESDAKNTVAEIQAIGGSAAFCLADVSDWEAVRDVVSRTTHSFGDVDILCCNAGIFPQTKLVDMDPAEWDHVMVTNLKSTFLFVKACIPAFERRKKGRIVVTSSITGPLTGIPGLSHYGASKAGQLGFLKTAALELCRYNVTINAIMPGNILTEGLKGLGQGYIDQMTAAVPMGRLGTPEDIAHAALFLASDEASFITGQTIIVDGGQVLPESLDAVGSI